MKKRAICCAALALAAALLLSGCKWNLNLNMEETATVEPPATPEGFTEYKNEEKGYAIAYPSDWIAEEDYADASLVLVKPLEADGGYFVTMNVVTEEAAALPLKVYLASAEDELASSYDDYKKISSSEYTLNGVEAAELVYSALLPGEDGGDSIPAQLLQVLVIYNGRMYVITAATDESAFDETEPVFREVVSTFYPLADVTGEE